MDRVLEEVGEFCTWASRPSFMGAEGEDSWSWGGHLKCSAFHEVSVCGAVCYVSGLPVFWCSRSRALQKALLPTPLEVTGLCSDDHSVCLSFLFLRQDSSQIGLEPAMYQKVITFNF